MDPPEVSDGGRGAAGGGRRASRISSTCCFSLIFYLVVSFLSSFLLGFVGLAIESFSSSAAVSVPSSCRILSSSVDIRSSKVCELGIRNHKAENVFFPLNKANFRCHYDYYWASVFQVEYKEYFSGQIFHAMAEAPKEALPHDCRPDFGTAWLTSMKFKAKEPSTADTIRGYFISFRRFYSESERSGRNMVHVMAGAVFGMLVSMFTIILTKSLYVLARAMARKWDARRSRIRDIARRLRRVCLLVAYFSAMAWLTLQYGKMIGLKQLLLDSNISERTT